MPQAFAHQNSSGSIAYGVDPYQSKEAEQYDRPDIQVYLDEFVNNTDFKSTLKDVTKLIAKFNLETNCALVRKRSDDAAKQFV
jgi:hypothetical protein